MLKVLQVSTGSSEVSESSGRAHCRIAGMHKHHHLGNNTLHHCTDYHMTIT